MHSIKGGWVGQTFALSKSNESEGRKSRIRRSKEERKAMVESFIQKYQKLNNGSFPSLNLTHKEVGGSFYTVREIVRDIIQENRVLGPAKFSEEIQSTHHLEQNPLGSISLEPQFSLTMLSNVSQFVENQYQISGGKSISEPSMTSDGHHGDDEKVINGTQVDMEVSGFDEPKHDEIQGPEDIIVELNDDDDDNSDKEDNLVSDGNMASEMINNVLAVNVHLVDEITEQSLEVESKESTIKINYESLEEFEDESVKEEPVFSMSEVTPIEDVKVELFPVRTVTVDNDLDGRSSEVVDKAHSLIENDAQKVVLGTGFGSQIDEENSPPSSRLIDEEDSVVKASSYDRLGTTAVSEHGVEVVAEAKAVSAAIGAKTKGVAGNGSTTNGILKTAKEVDDDQQHNEISQKESNPTLDRMNLESWDRASKIRGRSQTNPFWAGLKAFIDSFIKFWSK